MATTQSEQTFELDEDEVETMELDLNPHDALFRFSSYRDYDPEADLSYSDLDASNQPGTHEDTDLFVLLICLAVRTTAAVRSRSRITALLSRNLESSRAFITSMGDTGPTVSRSLGRLADRGGRRLHLAGDRSGDGFLQRGRPLSSSDPRVA